MALVPYVIEKTVEGERSYDLFSRLLKDRIVMITGEVDEASMTVAVGELLFLNNEDNTKPIYLYIDSPGGSVIDGEQLIDVMHFITAPVYTVALGMAASMGAAILSAGEPGHRYCMPSSKILVHPQSGGTQGRTNDNVIAMNFENRMQIHLLANIAHNCHKLDDKAYKEIMEYVNALRDADEEPRAKLTAKTKKAFDDFKKTCNYDHWMYPREALEYGIVDQILTSEAELQ